MQIYRHGDLPITIVTSIKAESKKVEHAGSFTLALGETTGHRHVITAEREMMEIYDLGNGYFMLDLAASATISHEEHKTIVLPPGKYQVGREREYDWFGQATRRVID